MISDEWGYRLSSIIDGEGSFNIRKNRSACSCVFSLGMRADDEEFVRRLRDEAGGIGSIYLVHQDGAVNPLLMWQVMSRQDCLSLVRILERYPLRSKKRRDFVLWWQALDAWWSRDFARMSLLRDALMGGRLFGAEIPHLPPSSQQSLLAMSPDRERGS